MIRDSYNGLRADLEKSLNAAVDVKDAADALGRTLDRLRMDTRVNADSALMSRETDRLFDAARQASRTMLAVTEADVTARPAALTKKDRLKRALPWVGAGLGLLLTAWMELLGQHVGAFVALASAACSLLQLWLKTDGAAGEYSARTRTDNRELLRLTDRLIGALDDQLEQARQERVLSGAAEKPLLTSDLYAPLQMLIEAMYTQDGGYALKAVPQLENALEAQGVQIREYSAETKAWFDMFPGTEPGLTIRPALIKDGQVLARGQATEAMK